MSYGAEPELYHHHGWTQEPPRPSIWMVKARSSNLFLCCFVFSLFQHCFALNIYVYIVLFWLLFTRQISRLSIHSNQKSCYIVLVVLLESHLCLLFWSSAWKSESFSLWHLYLWKVNWWQVFSNIKCLCKLMMIIWYAMPCYYHVKTVNYHLTSDIWHYIVTLTLFILFMHIFTLQVPC